MRRLFGMMLLLAALDGGRTVTFTFARIADIVIAGAAEHTRVIPPDYPSFTRHYSVSYQVDFHDGDVVFPDDGEDEENEQETGGGDGSDGPVTFHTTVLWSISGQGAAFAEGCDPTDEEIDVVFTEGNNEDVHLTVEVSCTCTGGNGIGDEDSADFTIRSPVWDTYHGHGIVLLQRI